jgi:hypothetical protein
MIHFLSGFSGPGGSTIAFMTLVNLLNSKGIKSKFYGPLEWKGITCDFGTLNSCKVETKDVIVYHFLPIKDRMPCKKQILSCHETEVFPIKKIPNLSYDQIHFVSEFQKEWHGLDGVVIPNPIRKYPKVQKKKKIAAILGSIDKNKRIRESILKAKDDGFTDIRIYGNMSDGSYFFSQVLPLLSDEVTYRGVALDMEKVYSQVSHVYHSPILETFNLVKPECMYAGVTYVGNEGNDTKAEYWEDDRIVSAWEELVK